MKMIRLVLVVVIASAAASGCWAQDQCVQDGGNACLSICSTFTNNTYDLGVGKGDFKSHFSHIECSDSCSAFGNFINYGSSDYQCGGGVGEQGLMRDSQKQKLLEAIAKGRPILVAGCAGGLLRVQPSRSREQLPGIRIRDSWSL